MLLVALLVGKHQKITDRSHLRLSIFRQGNVEAKDRPFAHWERKDGGIFKPSHPVLDLLKHGVGKTPETGLKYILPLTPDHEGE